MEVVVGSLISAAAPSIGGAIGGLAATAVGKAFIGVGLSIGASYLLDQTKTTSGAGTGGVRGQQLSTQYDTNEPREIPVGTVATEGSFKYQNTFGPNGNDYVELVYALADVECDSLVGVIATGKALTLGSEVSTAWASGRTVAEYPGAMWISFHAGDFDQAADSDLVAHNDNWTSKHRGRGVCYVRITMKYSEKLFADGRPSFRFIIKAAKFYDWRKDSTAGGSGSHRWGQPDTYEWTDNPVVVWYNYRRGIFVNGQRLAGMNTPARSMPVAQWTAAANACDEDVGLKGGGAEKRYRANGWIVVGTDHGRVRNDFLAAMAGTEADCGGVIRIFPGVAQSSVMTISDADLISDEPLSYLPKLSVTSLTNIVTGQFSDPALDYEPNALPIRQSPDDVAADYGSELNTSYDLRYVTSGTQGQRTLEIFRREGRYQRSITVTLRARCCLLEAGDWITWTSDRYGFVSTKWRVLKAALQRDLTTVVELREISESIYAWNPAVDELDPLAPKPVAAGNSTFTAVQDFIIQTAVATSLTGAQRPGLMATYTPIDDPTVREILIQYRRIGDTVPLEYRHVLPGSGTVTWLNGVMGEAEYEARALPITVPERDTTWTGWVSTAEATGAQIVDIAAVANSVPPDTITPEMLDEMSRFLLSLSFAADEVFGSVNERLSEVQEMIVRLSDAASANLITAEEYGARIDEVRTILQTETNVLAQQIATISAQIDGDIATAVQTITTRVNQVEVLAGTKNRVFRQNTAPVALAAGDIWIHTGMGNQIRVATAPGTQSWVVSVDQRIPNMETAQTATASSLSQLTTRVGNNEASVFDLAESIDGVRARKTLGINANGKVALVDIAGNEFGTSLTFVGDDVYFSHPSVNGGNPMPFLAIKTVGGVNKFVFKGQMITDSFVSGEASFASLSAIVANLGIITAGLMRDTSNSYQFRVADGWWGKTDGSSFIDMKNGILQFTV
jgi:hypothetical protein